MIYLDNPATSIKKPKVVYDAMYKNTVNFSVNTGRGGHSASISGAKGIINAQEELAMLFNISAPERIAFTCNATHALNMAIAGILKPDDHAIITSMEHNSVIRPVHKICDYTMVYANEKGEILPKDIEKAIQSNTKLIIATHVSNVCGSVLPIKEIGKICKKHNIPFLLDSAQSAGILPIDVEDMNVSLLAFSGHKGLMGPLGTGGLYVKEGIELSPLIVGGTGTESKSFLQPTQFPDILHSGTMNTPAIMTLATAVKYVRNVGCENILNHEKHLAQQLISSLNNIRGVKVYGLTHGNRNGTVAFNIKDIDSQTASDILNREYSIATRGGYHCAYPAHITLGTESGGAIRAGFGYFSTKRDMEKLALAVYKMSKNNNNM